MSTKPILAFDTATTGATIALNVNGTITTRTLEQSKQAAELIPAIDALLSDANIAYADLAGIVTTVGPGSFTGVRIGLAALHGFALVHRTPIKIITTLEAMAHQVNRADAFIICLRAGKGEVYAQKFVAMKATGDIALYPEAKTDWDAPCFGNQLDTTDANYIAGPDAAILCRIADQLPTVSLAEAMPLYIRPPDAAIGAPLPWLSAH